MRLPCINYLVSVLIPFRTGLSFEQWTPGNPAIAVVVLIPFRTGLSFERTLTIKPPRQGRLNPL